MNDQSMTQTFPTRDPVLVTCGLPYASGPIHVGHLRTYVPADVFVRLLRKMGTDVTFVCGSDTHGTPVLASAEKEGVSPQELYQRYHRHYLDIFPKLNIFFDNYGTTDDPENIERTIQIVNELDKNGYIYSRELETPYCDKCQRSLPDRFVRGTCPYCNSDARGDECDQGCGKYLEPGEILNPRCAICGSSTRLVRRTHYYFKLRAFESFLKEYLEHLAGTKNARNYALGWVNEGLRDWCITRDIEWGIKFPKDPSLTLYVWVDAPIHYISSTEQWAKRIQKNDEWLKFWGPGNGKIVHFIGQDIVYHHCLFWPSMLKGSNYNLPYAIVASGMLKIEGHKFSRSRGYVIWVEDDYLRNGLDPDHLRYFMISATGHTRELDFSWDAFSDKVNVELAGTLGNFIYRSLYFTKKYFGKVPEGELDLQIRKEIQQTIDAVVQAANEYELKKYADELIRLASVGNNYFQTNQPWDLIKTDKTRTAHVLYNALAITKALAILAEPVMPAMAERVWSQLGYEGSSVHSARLEEALDPKKPGEAIGDPRPPVIKPDEKLIARLKDEIAKRISDAELLQRGERPIEEVEGTRVMKKQKEESMEKKTTDSRRVSHDEFLKMDLRAGKILSCERIPRTDRLLLLKVDIGSEIRTIVTGLGHLYSPEELTGITALFLTNLEPKKIGGVESNGMIIAVERADEPGKWVPVKLDGVPPGSKAA
ncbi:MAG: methionine--tRNA ligase [Candidatus Thorarchaeota archaeon]